MNIEPKSNLILQVQIPHEKLYYPRKMIYDEMLYQLSKKSCEEYAIKTNSEYLCITDNAFLPNKHAAFQRFIMFEMEKYDKILYIDSDAIISASCPNIFEIQFEGMAAVADFDEGLPENAYKIKQKQSWYNVFNQTPFCSGILLTDRNWRKRKKDYVFDLLMKRPNLRDQDILNIVQGEETYLKLSSDWGAWYTEGKYINHFGGLRRKKEFYKQYGIRANSKNTLFFMIREIYSFTINLLGNIKK